MGAAVAVAELVGPAARGVAAELGVQAAVSAVLGVMGLVLAAGRQPSPARRSVGRWL